MDELTSHREILERLARISGLSLAELTAEPVAKPAPFDPAAHRVRCASAALDALLPSRYRHVAVQHPRVQDWIRDAQNGGTGSLLLAGPIGRGKTCEAYGALRSVVLERAAIGPRSPSWATATHAALNDAARPGNGGIREFLAADLVLIDDLGAARVTEWNADVLYQVIDTRWANERPVIATTNLDPDELSAMIGERLVDRIFGMCSRIVHLDGPVSRRRA